MAGNQILGRLVGIVAFPAAGGLGAARCKVVENMKMKLATSGEGVPGFRVWLWLGLAGLALLMGLAGAMAAPAAAPVPPPSTLSSPQAAAAEEKELSVEEAVALGLAHSPLLGITRARLDAARSVLRMAYAQGSPRLSVSAYGVTSSMPMIYTSPPEVMPQSIKSIPDQAAGGLGSLMLMFPLFTGGRVQAGIQGAQQGQQAALLEDQAKTNEVAALIRSGFYQVLLAREALGAYRDQVRYREGEVALNEDLFRVGKIPRVMLLRSRTELAQARGLENQARAGLASAVADFSTLLGLDSSAAPVPGGALEPIAFSLSREEVAATARARNPDLLALQHRADQALALVTTARAGFAPQVSLTAMGDLASNGAMAGQAGYGVGVVAALPLVDGGERKARLDEAQAGLSEAREMLRQRTLEVEQVVTRRWEEWHAASQNAELAQAALAEAEEVLRISELRYRTGKGIYLETLDAVQSFTQARLLYLQSVAAQNAAVADLWAVMGRSGPGEEPGIPGPG